MFAQGVYREGEVAWDVKQLLDDLEAEEKESGLVTTAQYNAQDDAENSEIEDHVPEDGSKPPVVLFIKALIKLDGTQQQREEDIQRQCEAENFMEIISKTMDEKIKQYFEKALSYSEMIKHVRDFITEEAKGSRMAFVVFLGHGSRDGKLCFLKGEKGGRRKRIDLNDVLNDVSKLFKKYKSTKVPEGAMRFVFGQCYAHLVDMPKRQQEVKELIEEVKKEIANVLQDEAEKMLCDKTKVSIDLKETIDNIKKKLPIVMLVKAKRAKTKQESESLTSIGNDFISQLFLKYETIIKRYPEEVSKYSEMVAFIKTIIEKKEAKESSMLFVLFLGDGSDRSLRFLEDTTRTDQNKVKEDVEKLAKEYKVSIKFVNCEGGRGEVQYKELCGIEYIYFTSPLHEETMSSVTTDVGDLKSLRDVKHSGDIYLDIWGKSSFMNNAVDELRVDFKKLYGQTKDDEVKKLIHSGSFPSKQYENTEQNNATFCNLYKKLEEIRRKMKCHLLVSTAVLNNESKEEKEYIHKCIDKRLICIESQVKSVKELEKEIDTFLLRDTVKDVAMPVVVVRGFSETCLLFSDTTKESIRDIFTKMREKYTEKKQLRMIFICRERKDDAASGEDVTLYVRSNASIPRVKDSTIAELGKRALEDAPKLKVKKKKKKSVNSSKS